MMKLRSEGNESTSPDASTFWSSYPCLQQGLHPCGAASFPFRHEWKEKDTVWQTDRPASSSVAIVRNMGSRRFTPSRSNSCQHGFVVARAQ